MKKDDGVRILVRCVWFCFFLFLGVTFSSCRSNKNNNEQLTVAIKEYSSVLYRTENKENLLAKYYISEEAAENYVVITLPNKEEITLPQVISASGARYSDGEKFEWWTKGSQGILKTTQKNNAEPIYLQCVSLSK